VPRGVGAQAAGESSPLGLFISKKTVSVHVSSILRKLDAGNRVDAGEIGQRAGLGRELD
jgi:hypothetical protein